MQGKAWSFCWQPSLLHFYPIELAVFVRCLECGGSVSVFVGMTCGSHVQ